MYKLKTQRHTRLSRNTELFLMLGMFRSSQATINKSNVFQQSVSFVSACGDIAFQLRNIKVLMIWQKQCTSFLSEQILCFNKILLHNTRYVRKVMRLLRENSFNWICLHTLNILQNNILEHQYTVASGSATRRSSPGSLELGSLAEHSSRQPAARF